MKERWDCGQKRYVAAMFVTENMVFYKTVKKLNYTQITSLFGALLSTLLPLALTGSSNKQFASSTVLKTCKKLGKPKMASGLAENFRCVHITSHDHLGL